MSKFENIYPHRHCVICTEMIEEKLVDRRAIRFCSDKCKEEYEVRKRSQAKMQKVAWAIAGIMVFIFTIITIITIITTFKLV